MQIQQVVIAASLLLVLSCQKQKFASTSASGQTGSGAVETTDGSLAGGSSSGSSGNGGSAALPGNSVDTASKGGSGSTPGGGLAACVQGDKIVVPWTGAVKECFDQGKTYLFDTQTCAEIRKADFACDWNTVQAKLSAKDLLTDTLKQDAANGAKLISCGQSADGNRIAVQWVKMTSQATPVCNQIKEGAGITTGCYLYYANQTPPPPPQTEEEKRQRVYACLNTL